MSSRVPSPVLAVASVSKRFGGIQALKDVSIDLFPGEVHALCGANGAGKSTLKNIIAGAVQPDTGGILFDGEPIQLGSSRDAIDRGIHAVHQELGLLATLTVEENLFIGRFEHRAGFIPARRLRAAAQAVLDDFGLLVSPTAKVGSLSVGQQQLVEIVRAVAWKPKVLLLDEPSAVLVGPELERVFETVRRLRAEGVAIVYVSHRLDEVFDLADRVSVLRNGEHVLTAPIEDIDHDRLVTAMIGEAPKPGSVGGAEDADAQEGSFVLEVKGLQAGKGRLRDIDLDVREGEVVGLAGLMGSGRSHLLKCVFGVDDVDAGEIRIAGNSLAKVTPQSLMKRGVAFVSEDRKTSGLFINWNIRKNLTLPRLPSVSKGRLLDIGAERDVAKKLADHVGAPGERIEQLVAHLSGGNQQKIAIGRWLSERPRLLLIDEPTRGVDVGAKTEIYGIISSLKAEGAGVLMVSSEFDELLQVCDRVLVIEHGRIVATCDPATTTAEDLLRMCTPKSKAVADV